MRDYRIECEKRIAYIRAKLEEAHARGVVFGNSGGKDSALCGILCKLACENTVGVLLPCASKQNYGKDTEDALALASLFGIETRVVDLTRVKEAMLDAVSAAASVTADGDKNLPPRLRMAALYTIAASEGRLVCGTGNRSEAYLGYFTKWGDGAYDFDPIADLTVREVYEFLRYLGAPESILEKAPSAGLFDGQTDEGELGFSYETLDAYLLDGVVPEKKALERIEHLHKTSAHKRALPSKYQESDL